MASKFVIREKGSQSYCYSSKGSAFTVDLNEAVLFASRANAEKVVRQQHKHFRSEMNPYGGNTWSLVQEDGTCQAYFGGFRQEYLAMLDSMPNSDDQADYMRANVPERSIELEVVEVRLTLV